MGNLCYGEHEYSEMGDITFPVNSPKAGSRAKARKRLLSPDKKQRMRKSKSQNQVRFRMSETYTKPEPQTADIVPKKIRKSGSSFQYLTTQCNTGVFTETPVRNSHLNHALPNVSRKNSLLAYVQGCKWKSINRDDTVQEFKARLKDYSVFIEHQYLLEGFVLDCARSVKIDENVLRINKIKFYVVNATQQGK